MLLQRLIADNEIGFNYDYMGYAEYEFGATARSRAALAQTYLDNNLASIGLQMVEVYGRSNSKAINVVVIAHKDQIAYIESQRRKDAQHHWYVDVDKSSMRSDNPKIVGWMRVSPGEVPPIFIIRQDLPDRGPRFENFIQPMIDHLLSEQKSEAETD